MEFVKLFLIEVTEELLYNIVYNYGKNDFAYETLSNKFKEKTRHQPMNFFGFGNVTEQRWLDFIGNVPGLVHYRSSRGIRVRINDGANYDRREIVYRQNNRTYLSVAGSIKTVATYRERFLIMSCKMIKKHFSNLGRCKDKMNNTPLHLIAALPGHYVDEVVFTVPLVKYLLQAGIDPLVSSRDGRNFLHTIVWSFIEEEMGDFDTWVSENEYFYYFICTINSSQYIWERYVILNMLRVELTPGQLRSLVSNKDSLGNTVTHEWAHIMSILNVEANFQHTNTFLEKLFNFGTQTVFSDDDVLGNVALHYAFHPKVFKILLQNVEVGCCCINHDGATPVLTMLQHLAALAFNDTSVFGEIKGMFRENNWMKYKTTLIKEAINMLEQFTELVTDNEEVQQALWIPDKEGNFPVNVVLMAIRFGSYSLGKGNIILDYTELRKCLVKLLSQILQYGNPHHINEKGQSALHVLLDMGDRNNNTIINDEHILQSVEILLRHNVNVNAADLEGHTPLDIANKYHCERNRKYTKLLIDHGAFVDLTGSEKRKLRSCPKRHENNAQRLIDINSKVTVVGKYRYSSQHSIGHGAFSSVFVAIKDENVDRKSGTINCRAYALKRVEKARMNPAEIKREIRTLTEISEQCDNIIKYHETFDDNSFYYLVLNLMDGDLEEFITIDSFMEDPAIRVQVMKEIITGLAYLHDHNFIHRDLKPRNILYTTYPTLHFKIADFGLTKNMSMMTSTRGSGAAMAAGTRCWMAPELIIAQSGKHTKQSDTFSLGLVLYFFYTLGEHPFAAESGDPAHLIEFRIAYVDYAQMQVILHSHGVSHPESINFFLALLNKDPSKRPPANVLHQHPFLWSEKKRIKFLKVIGDQPEAVHPTTTIYRNSALKQRLQTTIIGKNLQRFFCYWDQCDQVMAVIFKEITTAHPKKYRTDKVIDLLRFIRNAYVHRNESSSNVQGYLDSSIFLHVYPSLVLDAFNVVQQLGLAQSRDDIRQVLSSSTNL